MASGRRWEKKWRLARCLPRTVVSSRLGGDPVLPVDRAREANVRSVWGSAREGGDGWRGMVGGSASELWCGDW